MIEKLTENSILPLLPFTTNTVKIANEALEDKIIPFPNFDAIPFNKKVWFYEKGRETPSYQLYIHSLRVVAELLNYYKKEKKKEYLYKAKDITDSWISFAASEKTKMTWYDHPTANRTQVIIELIYYLNKLDSTVDLSRYFSQLETHCDYLQSDLNYRANNHGIMMDRALIMTGLVLGNEVFYLKGKSRIQQTFWLSFSHNGVHLENSPEYHLMVIKMFVEIEKYLNKNDDTLGIEINNMIKQSQNYLLKIKKPNGIIPAIGDSSEIKINSEELYWENFKDSESGLTIIKEESNKLYLAFICGFSTATHKHSDDLSIILSYDNQDYFVDSGKFNYSKSKERYYVVSNKAHSSFQLDEKYEKNYENKFTKEIWTDTFFDTYDYTVVSGYNKKYKNAFMRRTVYYVKKMNLILIIDYGISDNKKNWINRFNLNEKIEVKKNKNNSAILSINNSYLYLECLSEHNISIIDKFTDEIVENPIISKKANKKINNKQIILEENNKNISEFICCISFNEVPEVKILEKENYLVLYKKNTRIQLPKIQ